MIMIANNDLGDNNTNCYNIVYNYSGNNNINVIILCTMILAIIISTVLILLAIIMIMMIMISTIMFDLVIRKFITKLIKKKIVFSLP